MDDELDYGSDHSVHDDVDNNLSDDETDRQPKDRLDKIIDRKEKIATEKAFGISDTVDKHLCVTIAESGALRKELGATEQNSQLDSVLVHGVESMDEFVIQKMFADFRPEKIWKKAGVAIVQFHYRQEAAAMMLNMSKMMRRVRGRKIANEEGEVMSDDDDVEEGQIMQEKGDDVELIEGLEPNEKGIVTTEKSTDFITVDISARDVPNGKWRVLTKHVSANMFVLVRYATIDEFHDMASSNRSEVQKTGIKRGTTSFWTQETSNRGGLNVFDKEGKELEWDYEHDTRFYEDDKKEEKVEKVKLPQGVKVKGRGAVKCGFLFGEGSGSLASDDSTPQKKRKDDEKEYEKDDVVSRMGSSAHAVRPGRVERPMKDRIQFPGRNDPEDF
ncbi:CRE-KUP-1 protein [Caenorhabditis remanei]|uniref:CRE-KUP-1 protein n=1 Tax=Caenorhabditis remanei TaxID=31234 RepID=E3LPX4_CAERE|nr:CRE-KUP-1 protein [Caenorhabditis remanei]